MLLAVNKQLYLLVKHAIWESLMRELSLSEHEIIRLLSEGNCPKRYSRYITYIEWNSTVASC